MYDLEIIVPAETKEPSILERFVDFKKRGFQNIGNTKIKLILLASNDNNPKPLLNRWPQEIGEPEVIITPYKHVAQRIYHYYSEIIKPDTAHWYIRIDEDSMTDIGGLMKNLERLFDPQREYHINCDGENYKEKIEYNILSNMGFDWWYEHKKTYPPHDYEISITSNAAIKRIFANESVKNYFTLRKQFDTGHGDHGLCYAARMVKIHPTPVTFLSKNPYLQHFSSYGGHLNHIHYTAKEQNPCIHNWISSLDDDKIKLFAGQSFIFNDNENKREWIKLNSNQTVQLLTDETSEEDEIPEHFPKIWGVTKSGKLTFFMNDFEHNDPLVAFETNSNGSLYCRNYSLTTMGNKNLLT